MEECSLPSSGAKGRETAKKAEAAMRLEGAKEVKNKQREDGKQKVQGEQVTIAKDEVGDKKGDKNTQLRKGKDEDVAIK